MSCIFQSPPKNVLAPSTAGHVAPSRGRGRVGKNLPKMMKTNPQAGSNEVIEVQLVSLTLTLSQLYDVFRVSEENFVES
jgi:hypothetical protein